jgi:hypothetical protein
MNRRNAASPMRCSFELAECVANRLAVLRVFGLAALLPLPVFADPGYYMLSPYSEPGQTTVELRYWTTQAHQRPEVQWPELGLRYGMSPRWTTGLLASWIRSSQIPTRLSSWNWHNTWVLTQDDWPLEAALHGQLIRSQGGAGALEWGPLFQAELGRIRTGLNLVLAHDFNSPSPKPTELKLQWQFSYRLQPGLRLGLQGFSELGPWRNWLPAEQQSHRVGPALFQSIDLDDGKTLALQLAWLKGKTFGRSGSMLSARAAYSF